MNGLVLALLFWLVPPKTIRIASFNIQVFGTTKAANPRVMTVLSRIAREFDVMAVQEFRDETGTVPRAFLDRINRDSRVPYAMIAGPRLGRSSSKEQYVIYYREESVAFLDSFTVADRNDQFERPPLVARFRAGQFDFRLVVAHIKPEDAAREMTALADVARRVDEPEERDVILLGDFNADCGYFNENKTAHPLKGPKFHWVIADSMDTAVRSACTYDRIVLLAGTFTNEFIPNSATVYRYDRAFGIRDPRLVRAVSDHYPVFAEFRITGPDDDKP